MKDLESLIRKYQEGKATAEEKALVERHFLDTMDSQPIPDREDYKQEVFARLNQRYGLRRGKLATSWIKYAAAAILAVAIGWLLLDTRQQTLDTRLAAADIAPGGNRATLTLADGRTIDLSTEQSGIIVGEGITYLDGTEILDNRQAAGKESLGSSVSRLLSLTTPKGGQYQVALPDGSKVWLNAGSTLTYPSRFSGDERVVFLDGEAYFDIESMPLRPLRETSRPLRERIPFIVKTSTQTVEVLGTEFNISAYTEENEIKTTLVEGAVQIVNQANGTSSLRLDVPGQQAIIRQSSDRTDIQQVDVQPFIAWKSGIFNFSEENLESILRKVARWYDVEVEYTDPALKGVPFEAILPRYAHLRELLDVLEKAGDVRFEINKRTLIVKRKT